MSAATALATTFGRALARARPRETERSRPRLGGLRAALYAGPLYPFTLVGRTPRDLALHPRDLWPGDAAAGDRLFQGCYRFAGHEVTSATGPVWAPPAIDIAWIEAMHGFAWLRHLKASGGEMARRHARALVADWIRRCGDRWRAGVWDAAVTGRRVATWIACARFLLNGADPRWRSAFLTALAAQARHLARVAQAETAGARRIAALHGLLHARICLGGSDRRIVWTIRRLARECERQVLSDGGHLERSPARQCAVLADLVDCRELLLAAGRPLPAGLRDAIERMAPVLAAMRHGDGGLAVFNDSPEVLFPDAVAVLQAAASTAQPLASMRRVGFERLAEGSAVAIVDAGPAAGTEADHAGLSAFEMSVGAGRLIVNCGPHTGRDAAWTDALTRTAAHSTLALADGDIEASATVECNRHDHAGAASLDIAHDGYVRRFGFVHRRRLVLAADGSELSGEDELLPVPDAPPEGPQPFAVRFHLHPAVTATLAQHGDSVRLRLADGAEWRLRADGGSLTVNRSVYLADDFTCRHTDQVVIAGVCGMSGTAVRWVVRRNGRQ